MRFDRLKKLSLAFVMLGSAALAQTTATVAVLGGEQSSGSVWDSGNVSVTVNGLTRTVSYGQFSTPASVAAGLAALISRECYGVASAKADGATITFRLRYASAAPVAISGTSQWDSGHFANASFTFSQQQTVSPTQVTLVGNTGEAIAPNTQISLTATLAQNSATGLMQFYDRGVLLGTSVLSGSQASYTTPPLVAGAHELYAKYTGDGSYAGSTSNTVYATAADHSGPAIGTSVYWYSITTDGATTGYATNGNILAYNDAVMGKWSFGYDSLNRLISGNAQSGPVPQQYGSYFCWDYDSFGNRLQQTSSTASFSTNGSQRCYTNGTTLTNTMATYDTNNHILSAISSGTTTSPSYDANGNITDDRKNRYLYDEEGRVCAVQPVAPVGGIPVVMQQYIYDAEGRRVAKGTITSWSCDTTTNGFVQTAAYVDGPSGEQMTEMSVAANSSMSWAHTNVFVGGRLLATYQNDNGGTTPVAGNLHFALADWLGTKRVQTGYNGAIENNTWVSLPFGDTPSYSTPDATEQHFTGKERDTESGNDFFGARYYASNMGRWLSPDLAGPDFSNPQTLNKYRYGLNNPMRFVDPNGLYERDVHFDLTEALAYAAGYSASQARAIALADQGVDDNPATGPFAAWYSIEGYETRRDYHFTTPERRADMWNAVANEQGLGTYLHAEQDSFSHDGFGPLFGHLAAGHNPDYTYMDVGKADEMAKTTYNTLLAAGAQVGGGEATAVPYKLIAPYVDAFNWLTSKRDKKAALRIIKRITDDYRKSQKEEEKKKKKKPAAQKPAAVPGFCGAEFDTCQ